MGYTDFAVKFDPKTETIGDLNDKVLYSLYILRRKYNKPSMTFIGGDSGEGKSYAALALQIKILGFDNLDLRDFIDDVNVYTPLQYPLKVEPLLHEKRLRKVKVLTIHEAREVVKAKNWQSFLTQAIADVNAMSRTIKRLSIFIVSQFIRDVTTDVRYTLNYYCKVVRPGGNKARMYFYKMWKDDKDVDKPRLRKRKIRGYVIINGKYRRYTPKYIELDRPPKDITQIFNKQDYESKKDIIKHKLEKLLKAMKEDIKDMGAKARQLSEWYIQHPEQIASVCNLRKGKWSVNKSKMRQLHDITGDEIAEFQNCLNEKVKELKIKGGAFDE